MQHGGQAIAVMASIVVLLTGFGAGTLFLMSGMNRTTPADGAILAIVCLFVAVVILVGAWSCARSLLNLERGERIRDGFASYWRRNVVGYVARFVLLIPEDDTRASRLWCTIRTRREDDEDRRQTGRVHAPPGESSVAVSLPLGGWFAKPWIRSVDRDQSSCLQGWSVEFRAILNTDLVMVEIRKRNRFWGIDERIVTDVGSALRHLEYVASDSTALNRSWSDIVHYLDRELVYAQREREELEQQKTALFGILHESAGNPSVNGDTNAWMIEQVRQLVTDRDEARKERDEAIKFVGGLVQEIEQSTRLMSTIEGLRVLFSILYWFRCLYFGKEQFPEWEAKLERVRLLCEEKERRDRRRHGKKAVDPAPAPAA